MYRHFEYQNGANPYITFTDKRFFEMLLRYDVEQKGRSMFYVYGPRDHAMTTYRQKKHVLRDFAIGWQYNYANMGYSYSDLAEWAAFFTEYGRKYGLLSEFRENAII